MPAAPVEHLDALLRELSAERSLRGRLRVLGRAWALVKRLSPAERETVALRMGSDWLWKRLERSFLADGSLGEDEALVGRILDRMGDADPGEMRRMARTLRGGDRAQVKDLLLITLREALEEEAQEEEAALPAPRDALAEGGGAPRPEALADALAASAAPPTRPGAAPAPTSERAGAAAPSVETPPVDTLSGVVASTLARAVPPADAPSPPTLPAPPPVAGPLPPPAPDDPTGASLDGLERLRRLRALDREPAPGASLAPAERARLIDALGGGWASRRALSRMIRRGGLDPDEALALVGRLARPMQQAWCLGDLLARGDLAPEAVERVLAAAPTAAVRRRLRHRIHSASAGAAVADS